MMRKTEARTLLKRLPFWKLSPNGKSLLRTYLMLDFKEAVEFIRRISVIAEKMNHHPDIHLTNYRRLDLKLSTHSAGGLTLKDFKLAHKIEEKGREGVKSEVVSSWQDDGTIQRAF